MTRRAISAEQKAQRREHILQAAANLLVSHRYEVIGIKQIAESIGLTKAAVYLYFDTKESLFLALYERELDKMFDYFDEQLASVSSLSVANYASLVARAFGQAPIFSTLTGMLHTVLEQNVTADHARSFKVHTVIRTSKTGALLENVLGGLQSGDGVRLLLRLHLAVIGVWHVASPSQVISDLLDEPEFASFQVGFEEELEVIAHAIIQEMVSPHA